MDSSVVQDRIRDFIARELLHGEDRGLDAASPLLEWGVIESLSLVALINFLEHEFNVRVQDQDILPDNFANLAAITALVQRCGPKS